MTKLRRIGNILLGLLMIAGSILLNMFTEDAYPVIVFLLAVSLLLYGIRMFVFYFRMARHMVGGRAMLYRAVIAVDLGIFTMSLTDVPLLYVMLYLAGVHGFAGAIGILRSNEARKLQAPSWRLNLVHGIINVIMAILCLVFLKSIETAVLIYTIGLAYSGVMRIVSSARNTAIVYIQ